MMILVKETDTPDGKLLAACDEGLLGQTFSEGGLTLKVSEEFYKGELVPVEEFGERLKKANIANLVGEESVGKAVELGLALEESVLRIQGVPHVQCFGI